MFGFALNAVRLTPQLSVTNAARRGLNNQPMLWTAPRRVEGLSLV
jgi:hypothetical protein